MASEPTSSLPPAKTDSRTIPDTSTATISQHTDDNDKEHTSATGAGAGAGALESAVSNLKISGDAKGGEGEKGGVKGVVGKVDAGDVGFLSTNLEITKAHATDLLKSSNGDRTAALRAFIVPVPFLGPGAGAHV